MRNKPSNILYATWAARLATGALMALLAATTACGNDPTTEVKGPTPDVTVEGSDTTIAGTDTDQPDVTGTDDIASDIAQQPDSEDVGSDDVPGDAEDAADTPDVSGPVCPGQAGCACSSVGDCESGFCIDTPKGQLCAATCTAGCLDTTFKCVTVTGAGGDTSNICVPKYGKVCNPCSANSECQGPGNGDARCVDQGNNGAFCGTGCKADAECPAGYGCSDAKDVTGATSKQCVVKNGAACTCSPQAIALELSTKCFVASGEAKCEGKRTCLPEGKPNAPTGGGLTGCYAPEPTPESCDGKDNDCNGKTDESTCDDKNTCTDDICNGSGGCQNPNKTGPCDADGSVCTKDDKCVNGKCQTGETMICNDNNNCTLDACDAAKGCTATNNDGLNCDADNNECTLNDVCLSGACKAGAPKVCDSGDQCVGGKCNVVTGACVYSPKDAEPCNDASACTSDDKCTKIDAKSSDCGGTGISCDDKNPCTADSCDKLKGCLHAATEGSSCDDLDLCTESDACTAAGKCAGVAFDVAKKCDDKQVCTADVCTATGGCVNKVTGTDGTVCDDGNPCTANDKCNNGACAPGNSTCTCITDADCKDDGNKCNGSLYCDKSKPGAYECKVDQKTVVVCDATLNGSCKTVDCDTGTGQCVVTKKPKGLSCDADKDKCTKGDACDDGQCLAGSVLNCDDGNPCTDDSCDKDKGCVNENNIGPCNADSNACTQNDTCASGICVAGNQKVCDDKEGCTADTCEIVKGDCKYAPLTKSCTDDNACTTPDACGTNATTGTYTCISGKLLTCDDSNPCTKDSCDAVKGCSNVVDATVKVACYTGDPKTANKGQCKDGAKQCKADGTLDVCKGDVLPGPKELCDGVDNTCDGVMDEGCKPTAFAARYAATVLTGTGTKYGVRAFAGGSAVAGNSTGGKYSVQFGFYAWLKTFLGL